MRVRSRNKDGWNQSEAKEARGSSSSSFLPHFYDLTVILRAGRISARQQVGRLSKLGPMRLLNRVFVQTMEMEPVRL